MLSETENAAWMRDPRAHWFVQFRSTLQAGRTRVPVGEILAFAFTTEACLRQNCLCDAAQQLFSLWHDFAVERPAHDLSLREALQITFFRHHTDGADFRIPPPRGYFPSECHEALVQGFGGASFTSELVNNFQSFADQIPLPSA